MSVLALVEFWPLIVSDFASEYGIRLAAVDDLTWREFVALLTGLLSTDSRLYRRVTSEREDSDVRGDERRLDRGSAPA